MTQASDSQAGKEMESGLLAERKEVRKATTALPRGFAALDRLLLKDVNPKFAGDAELAVRSAFCVLVCGLPFLIDSATFPTVSWFVQKGFYQPSVVSFIVLHIKSNLGDTIKGTISGIRGVVAAVLNGWLLFTLFPGGYQEDSSSFAWWFGLIEGALFIFTLIFLNFENGAVIFGIKKFVGYWLAFLSTDNAGFTAPLDANFDFMTNKGVHDVTGVIIASVILTLMMCLPYPLTALYVAKDAACQLTDQAPDLLRLFLEFLALPSRNDEPR